MRSLFILYLLLHSLMVRAETPVQLIPLPAPLDSPSSQISGLTWCGDELIFLPQRPVFSVGDTVTRSVLYAVERQQILDYLDGGTQSLTVKQLPFDDSALRAGLLGFDGYEAIVCQGDTLWFAIETEVEDKFFTTTIVKGKRVTKNRIELHYKEHTVIDSATGIWNFSDETLVLAPDALISIHESNGVPEAPQATAISLISGEQKQITMPAVPYRVTDATALDEFNRFWVINYLWQGDEFTRDDRDLIAARHPAGKTHTLENNLERLIELELTNDRVQKTDTPPIYLALTQEQGRNWEGIVRLGERGFLLVTDEYPDSYFGFVPLKALD